MKSPLSASLTVCLLLFLTGALNSRAAQQLLIIGDSLSKEYEYELFGIGGNQDAIGTMNWCEILDQRRPEEFDFGGSGTHADLRLIGHAYNWSVPGAFAAQWRDTYLPADFPEELIYGTRKLEEQIRKEAERIVIFLGGNELRAEYGNLYDGKISPVAFADDLYDDLKYILNWVMDRKRTGTQVVVVNLPHLGGTPDKNKSHPYDPVKTGRVTEAIVSVNTRLAALAEAEGAGLADIYTPMLSLVTADFLNIGGVSILRDPPRSDGNTRYAFLGDGLHPNMPIQAVFAQIILDAFNAKFSNSIPRLTDSEILTNILELPPGLFFEEWAVSYNLPEGQRGAGHDPDADGMNNLLEYALNLNPALPDSQLLPAPHVTAAGGQWQAGMTFKPRAANGSLVTLTAQQSSDLQQWTEVPPANITQDAEGLVSIALPLTPGGPLLFLRLKADWPQPAGAP